MKIGIPLRITIVAVVVILAVVVCLVPLKEVAYTVAVDYEDTETYYEDEPYVVSEEYTEVEEQAVTQQKNTVLLNRNFTPYFGIKAYQTYIDITNKSNTLVRGQFMGQVGSPEIDFYVSDDTDPSLNVGIPMSPIIAVGGVSSYTFSFVPNRCGTYYFKFVNYKTAVGGSIQLNVQFEWQETVVEQVEVTKYRDVIKYRQVEKQRTVTRQRDETRYKKVDLLEYFLHYR